MWPSSLLYAIKNAAFIESLHLLGKRIGSTPGVACFGGSSSRNVTIYETVLFSSVRSLQGLETDLKVGLPGEV